MELVITPTGSIRCIYDEAIEPSQLGSPTIQRASHVEPTVSGQWVADLSPVDGPLLGPFSLRSEALSAEHLWLRANWLTLSAE